MKDPDPARRTDPGSLALWDLPELIALLAERRNVCIRKVLEDVSSAPLGIGLGVERDGKAYESSGGTTRVERRTRDESES